MLVMDGWLRAPEGSWSWGTEGGKWLLLLRAVSDFLQNLMQHSVRASVCIQLFIHAFSVCRHALHTWNNMRCLDDSAGHEIYLDVSSSSWPNLVQHSVRAVLVFNCAYIMRCLDNSGGRNGQCLYLVLPDSVCIACMHCMRWLDNSAGRHNCLDVSSGSFTWLDIQPFLLPLPAASSCPLMSC